MPIIYRCLLLDHDDTAVDSTAVVHYPAHLQALRVLRPERKPPTLEQWLLINFHGIMDHLVGELKLTREELAREYEIWRSHTVNSVPPFFPGFLDLISDFHAQGGLVAVISHSDADVIASHYRQAGGKSSFPDLVFGWTDQEERRKPSPWPVREALTRFSLAPEDALIVDDLKPGVLMSAAAGVAIAGAGWSHRIPEIARYMRAHTIAYCESIDELRSFLFR